MNFTNVASRALPYLLSAWFGLGTLLGVKREAHASETSVDVAILPAAALRGNWERDLAGEHWSALLCSVSTCELRPLGGTTAERGEQFVIATLRGVPAAIQRSVPTWYTVRTQRAPEDDVNGTLGVTIRAESGRNYRVLPRWNPHAQRLTVYLEAEGLSQPLGVIDLAVVDSGLATQALLLWAGDIDRDSRVDLITGNWADPTNPGVHLWLSSRAAPGELVGDAASSAGWVEDESEDQSDDEGDNGD